MDAPCWPLWKIIETANALQSTGCCGASNGERIAAAFVLNRPDYLPETERSLVAAWDSLGQTWQAHVRHIQCDYMHLIAPDHTDGD